MDTRWYMVRAYKNATNSPDPSNQNGSVLIHDGPVIIDGWNDFPRGLIKPALIWNDRDEKMKHVSHAEECLIQKAARLGIKTDGTIMVCPWAACMGCARDIIMAGVKRLIIHDRRMATTPARWQAEVEQAMTWMKRAGVEVEVFEGSLPEAPRINVNGQLWQP